MRCSGCRWSCQEDNVPPLTREEDSWDSPRLHLHGGVDQEWQVMGLLGLKVTALQQLHQVALHLLRACRAWDLPIEGGGFGCWLTLYSLCFTTRNQVELAWGKNSHWGETPPSATCFPCTDALFQASATMADKFSCSCSPLGPGFQLYSSLLQTGVSEILSESEKTARIMSCLWMAPGKNFATTQQKLLLPKKKKKRLGRRSVFTMNPSMQPIFSKILHQLCFLLQSLFFSRHKSFPLNHGEGRKSKKYGFFFFFTYYLYDKFFCPRLKSQPVFSWSCQYGTLALVCLTVLNLHRNCTGNVSVHQKCRFRLSVLSWQLCYVKQWSVRLCVTAAILKIKWPADSNLAWLLTSH